MLARRLCSPLSRDGMVLPLLAGCLALTLLAGTLLTVLTTGQGRVAQAPGASPGGSLSSPGGARLAPASHKAAPLLPDRIVLVNGNRQSLRELSGRVLVLALIPPRCGCLRDLRRLVERAARAGASTYLLGTQAQQLYTLTKQVGLSPSHAVADFQQALPLIYHPSALGGVLVRADRVVRITLNPVRDPSFLAALRSVAGPTQ